MKSTPPWSRTNAAGRIDARDVEVGLEMFDEVEGRLFSIHAEDEVGTHLLGALGKEPLKIVLTKLRDGVPHSA